jgi:hypothetical protein
MSIEKCISRVPTSFELILHVEDRKPLSLLDSLTPVPQIFAYRPETQVRFSLPIAGTTGIIIS